MAGRAVDVLLAVATLLMAVAARAADDDDKTQPWQCFRSCVRGYHHHHDDHDNGAAVVSEFPSGAAKVSAAVSGECKNNSCHDDACFKDLPAISYPQCAIATCLSHPHHSRKKTACLKDRCDKCFRNGPPSPGPPKPAPPTPGPSPTPPSPPN